MKKESKIKKIQHTEPVNFKVSEELYNKLINVVNHDGDGNLSLTLRRLIEKRYDELKSLFDD